MSTTATRSRGLDYKPVTIRYILDGLATCMDDFGHDEIVPMDIQRTKGVLPEAGERWIIDKMFGVWTFAAILAYEGADLGGGGGDGVPLTLVFADEVRCRSRVTSPTLQIGVSVAPSEVHARAGIDGVLIAGTDPELDLLSAEVAARSHVATPVVQVGVTVSPNVVSARTAIDASVDADAGAGGGSAPAGFLEIAADGSGDYTTLAAALTFISGSGVSHWIIYLRGTTSENNITYTGTDITIIGTPGSSITQSAGGKTLTLNTDITLVGASISFTTINLNGTAKVTDGGIGCSVLTSASFASSNSFLSATTSADFNGDCYIVGGEVFCPAISFNNLDWNMSGVRLSSGGDIFSWIAGTLSGTLETGGATVNIKGATNSYVVLNVVIDDAVLNVQKNRNSGTVTGTGSRFTVSGNNNKFVVGVGLTTTNTGSGNVLL